MKQRRQSVTADDVRYIITDTLEQTGLDKVPKKLETLDKILESVDKLVGEVKGYREEQDISSDKITKIEEHLHLTL